MEAGPRGQSPTARARKHLPFAEVRILPHYAAAIRGGEFVPAPVPLEAIGRARPPRRRGLRPRHPIRSRCTSEKARAWVVRRSPGGRRGWCWLPQVFSPRSSGLVEKSRTWWNNSCVNGSIILSIRGLPHRRPTGQWTNQPRPASPQDSLWRFAPPSVNKKVNSDAWRRPRWRGLVGWCPGLYSSLLKFARLGQDVNF